MGGHWRRGWKEVGVATERGWRLRGKLGIFMTVADESRGGRERIDGSGWRRNGAEAWLCCERNSGEEREREGGRKVGPTERRRRPDTLGLIRG